MRKKCAARSGFVTAADVSMDIVIIRDIVKTGSDEEHPG